MKKARLKQLGLAFCLLGSLFVSSVSACTCSHHPEKEVLDVSSCHQHSETAATEHHQSADSNETVQTVIPQDECCCAEPAPKVIAKSETLKIEKQSLAVLPSLAAETVFVTQSISVKSEFITPFYLTKNSFYNLSPGRAPPGL